jgi:hypothetical protein
VRLPVSRKKPMRKNQYTPSLAALLLLLGSPAAHAAVSFPLSNVSAGLPWAGTGGEASVSTAVISDPFAYNPDDPTSVSPEQRWFVDASRSTVFLTQGNDAQNYWSATVSLPTGGSLQFLDVWGRTDYAGAEQSRHQDLVITLSDGVTTWSSTSWSGVSAAPSSYGRFDFTTAGVTGSLLTTATTITIGHSDGSSDYLLLAEVRAGGTVPETGALAVFPLVAGGLLSLRKRRR